MIFFAGIYYGAMYGGSTTSILLNTPGEAGSMVTAHGRQQDGQERPRRRGARHRGDRLLRRRHDRHRAGHACSRRWSPSYAVQLGPPEYFMLMLLAFMTVSAVLGKSTLRGMTALFVGLAIGLIGIDQISGQARYTGGVPELMDGIEVVLIAVGLFAVGEALYVVLYEGRVVETQNKLTKVHMTRARVAALVAGLAARAPRSAFRSAPSRPAAARSRPS